jgi:transglutaminase-like putative cysteine protease
MMASTILLAVPVIFSPRRARDASVGYFSRLPTLTSSWVLKPHKTFFTTLSQKTSLRQRVSENAFRVIAVVIVLQCGYNNGMKKRTVLFFFACAAVALLCVGLAFNANNGGLRAVHDGASAHLEIKLTPVVILTGQTITPDAFIQENNAGSIAAFAAVIDTRLPGRHEVPLEISWGRDEGNFRVTALLYILEPARIVEKEAGTENGDIRTADFIANWDIVHPGLEYFLRFITDVGKLDLRGIGWHDVTLSFNGHEFTSTLRMTDTVPPVSTPVDVVVPIGQAVEPGDFVRDIIDISPVTVFFEEEPDIFTAGEHRVTVILADAYDNRAVSVSTLTVLPNTSPPVLHGVRDLEVLLGGTVMFRQGVTAVDSFGNAVPFTVEHNVDLDTPGVYGAAYVAVDANGNRAEEGITVTVLEVEEEMLNQMVQAVIDRIIRADMTQREMAQAIFDWIGGNVGYTAGMPQRSVYEGAFRALQYRSGDCFTFYAIAEVLLTRAGIPNMRIERIPGTPTRHYWNLVNADGNGWHHFDTTPTIYGGINRFMFTESQAAQNTETMLAETRTRNYYTYDKDLYPVTVVP